MEFSSNVIIKREITECDPDEVKHVDILLDPFINDYSNLEVKVKSEEHENIELSNVKLEYWDCSNNNQCKEEFSDENEIKVEYNSNDNINTYQFKEEVNDKNELKHCKTLKTENQYEEICYDNSESNDFEENVDMSEVSRQSNHNDGKFIFQSKNDRDKPSTSFSAKSTHSDHLPKQHKKKGKRKIHKCNVCSYHTTVKYDLYVHQTFIHNEPIKISCQFCDKLFTAKPSLDNHMLKQHKNDMKSDVNDFVTSKIHTCKICNSYETTNKSCLDRHVNSVHNEQRSKACQFCDKSFTTKYGLDDHLLKNHKNDAQKIITSRIHICKVCNYQTTNKTYLNRHFNAFHNDDRSKMKCTFCEKTFTLKRSIDDHLLKQHKKEVGDRKDLIKSKVHSCRFCDYKTTHKDHLNGHINATHKEQK